VNALIVSGFSTRRFVFEGFLQGKEREKKERLGELSADTRSIVFYEAPHRLIETLALMAEVFGGDRRVALCREMTKLNEEILRVTMSEALTHFEANPPRGEFVLVVEGASAEGGAFWENLSVAEHVAYYTDTMGMEKMAAVKAAARDRGVAKNVIYKELL